MSKLIYLVFGLLAIIDFISCQQFSFAAFIYPTTYLAISSF